MEESVIKRVMPNSLEAEQSVIGSMIMDREAVMAASEILTTEDFYHKQYGILFEAMLELFNDGQPVDLVTLQNRLKEKNVPPEVSSLEYVKMQHMHKKTRWRTSLLIRKRAFLHSYRTRVAETMFRSKMLY